MKFFSILALSIFALCSHAQSNSAKEKADKERYDLDSEIWDLMDSVVAEFGPGKTWYDVFDVAETAHAQEIQTAYRKMSMQFHPDKNPSEEAAKKFKIMASIAKLLKSEIGRKRYEYYLIHGVPYWRGRYFYRKSENINIFVSLLLILVFGAACQFGLRVVWYRQVKAGLQLIEQQRLKPRKQKTAMVQRGLFDDANIRSAMEYLVLKRGIAPEVIVDDKEWKKFVAAKYYGEENKAVALYFPSIFDTYLFSVPLGLLSFLGPKKAVVVEKKLE